MFVGRLFLFRRGGVVVASTGIAQVIDIARRAGSGEDSEDVAMQAICTFWGRRRELLWDQAPRYIRYACLEARRTLSPSLDMDYLGDSDCQVVASGCYGRVVEPLVKLDGRPHEDAAVDRIAVRAAISRAEQSLGGVAAQLFLDGHSFAAIGRITGVEEKGVVRHIRGLRRYI